MAVLIARWEAVIAAQLGKAGQTIASTDAAVEPQAEEDGAPPMPATVSAEERMKRLLAVFSNNVSNSRFEEAVELLGDDTLTVNEKLTAIHDRIRIPPTASAQVLGELLGGVTRQAVTKTEWWDNNRKDKDRANVDRRKEVHQKRAKQAPRNEGQDADN